ncbi:MAG: hypothetical protein PVI66_03325 [Candidatus Aminicenantes bacterium]
MGRCTLLLGRDPFLPFVLVRYRGLGLFRLFAFLPPDLDYSRVEDTVFMNNSG